MLFNARVKFPSYEIGKCFCFFGAQIFIFAYYLCELCSCQVIYTEYISMYIRTNILIYLFKWERRKPRQWCLRKQSSLSDVNTQTGITNALSESTTGFYFNPFCTISYYDDVYSVSVNSSRSTHQCLYSRISICLFSKSRFDGDHQVYNIHKLWQWKRELLSSDNI